MTDDSSHSTRTPPTRWTDGVAWTTLRRRLADAGVLDAVHVGPDAPRPASLVVGRLVDDSRMIDPQSSDDRTATAFVAVPGTDVDGHAFIDTAIQNGARLIVGQTIPATTRRRHPDVVFASTSDARRALAVLAAAFYDDPAAALQMVGVTGTNGKTTVAYLTHHLLTALGDTTGLISTIEVRTGAVSTNAALTTPGPLELHRTLRRMVDDGCTACTMEVSSHALDQDRVYGIEYDVGIFTNLTTDHLDYHGTLAHYRAAKKRLFDGLPAGATAVVNADDEAAAAMVADTAATVRRFGLASEDVDVSVDVLDSTVGGLRLRIDGRECTFRLAGRFNAYNLAAAYTTAVALGFAPDDVLDALAEADPVPGRFQQLRFDSGTTVVVDYAHTPDALENILSAIRATKDDDAVLWCVFGCGGDRDPSKRRVMGSVAETLADRVIVTSDNPRTEDPETILNDIRRGMSRPGDAQWIADREDAIRAAATQSTPGDVVLIAGKGHETYQIIGTHKRPFDDVEVARRSFSNVE